MKENETVWEEMASHLEWRVTLTPLDFAPLVKMPTELLDLLEQSPSDAAGAVHSGWESLPLELYNRYLQPSLELCSRREDLTDKQRAELALKWLKRLCPNLVAAAALKEIVQLEASLGQARSSVRGEAFAARLWSIGEADVYSFEFATEPPGASFFRSVLPASALAAVLRSAVPARARELGMDPKMVEDFRTFDDGQLLAGAGPQLVGMFAPEIMRFLGEHDDGIDVWLSRVIPVGSVMACGVDYPFIDPKSLHRCGLP